MTDLLIQLLQEEEGCTLKAKPDSKEYWEIGWGHDLPYNANGWEGLEWSQELADSHLTLDAAQALEFASELTGFYQCNNVRQAVLGAMCYQLGSLVDWPKFKAALANGDYVGAAHQGLTRGDGVTPSEWVVETPKRARRAMQMLVTGLWVPHT